MPQEAYSQFSLPLCSHLYLTSLLADMKEAESLSHDCRTAVAPSMLPAELYKV